jgi:hypothetical protein
MKEANDITTYDELFRKLNTIDPEGEKYDISKKGEEFFLEYGEGENLGVFRVCHKNGIMEVTNAEGTTEKLSYAQFYHAFEEKKCSRIAKITNTTSLLSSLSGLHKGGDEYAKLLIDKTKNGDNFIALEQKDIKENDRIITSDFINGK